MFRRCLLLLSAFLVVVALFSLASLTSGSTNAAGKTASAPHTEPHRMLPFSRSAPAVASSSTPSCPPSPAFCDLIWHQGPVQEQPVAYAIFWGPKWVTDSGRLNAYGQRAVTYLQDVANTSYAALLTQYFDAGGFISQNLQFGGMWIDPSTPPTLDAKQSCFSRPTIADAAIQAEVDKAIGANTGWPSDNLNATYLVYTPPDDAVNNGSGTNKACSNGSTEANPGYCGYHNLHKTGFFSLGKVEYAEIVFPTSGCLVPVTKSGLTFSGVSVQAESLADITAHEQFESASDPDEKGWYDVEGSEMADKCSSDFSKLTTLQNGVKFEIQLQYSNRTHSCQNSQSSHWVFVGPMTHARTNHTATLMPNGQVLVIGGDFVGGPCCPPQTAELYNPKSGSWSLTNGLIIQRDAFTATLLNNGKVLVAGGLDNNGAVADAELYDPTTGGWTTTGQLKVARSAHTATLLPNGQVLVAGGGGGGGALTSAELYDPQTGTWTRTKNPMSVALGSQTATLLSNGQVLFLGLSTTSSSLQTLAELYNPQTDTWSMTNSPTTDRAGFSVTLLLNGQVLVAGGYNTTTLPLTSAELYNPQTGKWTPTGSLGAGRFFHTATLLPTGQVLVAGGSDGSLTPLVSAELYDPTTGKWSATDSMNDGRRGHTATLLQTGQVLVAGGSGNSNVLASAELYT